jgi:hypothetical protein
MNTTIRTILITLAAVVFGAALFVAGAYFGRARYAFTPYGMMGGYGPGGMMGNSGSNNPNSGPYGYGPGMMGGMMNGGMMGGPGLGGLGAAEPISVEDARSAVESYLVALGNDDLAVKEIMIFDNGGYAIIQKEQRNRRLNC